MDLLKGKRATVMKSFWQALQVQCWLGREAGEITDLTVYSSQAHFSKTSPVSPAWQLNLFLWNWDIFANSFKVTETGSNCLKAICQCSRQLPFHVRLLISLSKKQQNYTSDAILAGTQRSRGKWYVRYLIFLTSQKSTKFFKAFKITGN